MGAVTTHTISIVFIFGHLSDFPAIPLHRQLHNDSSNLTYIFRFHSPHSVLSAQQIYIYSLIAVNYIDQLWCGVGKSSLK